MKDPQRYVFNVAEVERELVDRLSRRTAVTNVLGTMCLPRDVLDVPGLSTYTGFC